MSDKKRSVHDVEVSDVNLALNANNVFSGGGLEVSNPDTGGVADVDYDAVAPKSHTDDSSSDTVDAYGSPIPL